MTEGARAQYYIGSDYNFTPTQERPVWLLVHNYTQKDIDKSSHDGPLFHCKFDLSQWGTEPVALLRYNFEYHPQKYYWIFDPADVEFIRRGNMNSKNPNGLDLFNRRAYEGANTLVKTKEAFRDWWVKLKDNVEESATNTSFHDGRSQLLSQMSAVGIIDCINNDDIPAALYLVKNTKDINHINWQVKRDEIIPILENGLRNHYHLMDDNQKKRFSPYVPPADYAPTNSGTMSGTMASAESDGMTIIKSV